MARTETSVPLRCFAPVADHHARALILGSMPGVASLRAGRYYAHPRNPFWRILGEFTGVTAEEPYERRVMAMKKAGIALWDVIASCHRDGSLDASIVEPTVRANDFAAFFRTHPDITHVFFNGAKAETSYHRHVRPTLVAPPLIYARLPSTSPAYATLTPDQKRAIWLERLRAALLA